MKRSMWFGLYLARKKGLKCFRINKSDFLFKALVILKSNYCNEYISHWRNTEGELFPLIFEPLELEASNLHRFEAQGMGYNFQGSQSRFKTGFPV